MELSGIAVGMATNIPPHNMSEVIEATVMLIEKPGRHPERNHEGDACGPDFPTGGYIAGKDGILAAYKTGRGTSHHARQGGD